MNVCYTVFRKELKDLLRNRRAIITSILLPLLMFPVLILLAIKVRQAQVEQESGRVLTVGIVNAGQAGALLPLFDGADLEVVNGVDIDDVTRRMESGEFDGVFLFSKDFEAATQGNEKLGYINFYYKSDSDPIVRERLNELLNKLRNQLQDERYERLGITREQIKVVDVRQRDLASVRERLAEVLGGIIPYLFVFIAFAACMMASLELGAGEKERGTMEALLSTPANRKGILAGKLLAVTLAGIIASLLSIVGLGVSVAFFADEMTGKFIRAILELLELRIILLVALLLIPINVLFAGMTLSLSIYAKTVMEGQSLTTPFTFAIVIPLFIGMMPGFELTTTTALIPLFNVSLAIKEIVSGSATVGELVLVYGSMIALALAMIAFTSWWFGKESTLFRAS